MPFPAVRRWAVRLGKIAIIAILAWGGHHTLNKAYLELQTRDFDWGSIQPGWLVFAACVYLLGQLPAALFWHDVLYDLGQRPGLYRALRANLIGHLGKYVPGKALVVVLRAALVRNERTTTGAAVAAVFYETFTGMAVGSMTAAIVLATRVDLSTPELWSRLVSLTPDPTLPPGADPKMFCLAILLAIATGLPSIPFVFRTLLSRLKKIRPSKNENASYVDAASPDEPTVRPAAFHVTCGTLDPRMDSRRLRLGVDGIELVGDDSRLGVESDLLATWPLLTACAALAIVAGFVSLIPGGLGVRELVFLLILSPLVDHDPLLNVAVPVVLRVEWLLAELTLAGVMYVIPPRAEAFHRPATE
ncbi:MAG: lysylphosphatidylglycerol synthase domain-containing protein [Pirellulales bacterium]